MIIILFFRAETTVFSLLIITLGRPHVNRIRAFIRTSSYLRFLLLLPIHIWGWLIERPMAKSHVLYLLTILLLHGGSSSKRVRLYGSYPRLPLYSHGWGRSVGHAHSPETASRLLFTRGDSLGQVYKCE